MDFFISETHDAYTFVLDSLFKMCPLRGRKDVHAVFSDEFMTKPILGSIDMKDPFIIYNHFHLKKKLEKVLLSIWVVISPFINLMFNANDEVVLNSLYRQAIIMCKNSNHSVMTLNNLMPKKIIGLLI